MKTEIQDTYYLLQRYGNLGQFEAMNDLLSTVPCNRSCLLPLSALRITEPFKEHLPHWELLLEEVRDAVPMSRHNLLKGLVKPPNINTQEEV